MRLLIASLAVADLKEIGDFIALDTPPRALSCVLERRAAALGSTIRSPFLPAKARPKPARPAVRSSLDCYRSKRTTVRIARILDGAREAGAQFVSGQSTRDDLVVVNSRCEQLGSESTWLSRLLGDRVRAFPSCGSNTVTRPHSR